MFKIETIKTHAFGRWPEILLNLAPHLEPMVSRDRKHGPCPLCGGKDRARCHNDFSESGGVFCNQCGGGADGIAVLQWVIVMVVFTLYQLLPGGPAALLYFGLVGGLLLYDFYVARVALDVGPGHAIAIAVIGFLMALLIDFTVIGLA